jgi:hypothetical protein
MTKDQISALFEQTLREACDAGKAFDFYRLYELIEEKAREEEREACAKFIEHDYVRQFERPWRVDLSAAIRARGNTT